MTREDFEVWLEEHGPEAFDRIETPTLSLSQWIRSYGAALKFLADEYGPPDDYEPAGSDEGLPDFNPSEV